MLPNSITINTGLPVKIGYLWLRNCNNMALNFSSTILLEQTIKQIQQKFSSRPLSTDPIIQQVRLLFRKVGIDPTKYRPSGEALMRRALKNEPVISINPIVDCNNICSMETGLPFGCYDTTKIQGNIIIRLGLENEQYQGVAKPINIYNKLCAADSLGAFGSPISDSARTKITPTTTDVLVLGFGHTTTTNEYLLAALQLFADLAKQYLQASISEIKLFPVFKSF